MEFFDLFFSFIICESFMNQVSVITKVIKHFVILSFYQKKRNTVKKKQKK